MRRTSDFLCACRLVEEIAARSGVVVWYETILRWGKSFDPEYAPRLCRKQPSPHDRLASDEVVISIAGQ